MKTISKSAPIGKIKRSMPTDFRYRLIKDGNRISVLATFNDLFGLRQEVKILPYLFRIFNSCYRIFLNAGYPWPKDTDQCKKLLLQPPFAGQSQIKSG